MTGGSILTSLQSLQSFRSERTASDDTAASTNVPASKAQDAPVTESKPSAVQQLTVTAEASQVTITGQRQVAYTYSSQSITVTANTNYDRAVSRSPIGNSDDSNSRIDRTDNTVGVNSAVAAASETSRNDQANTVLSFLAARLSADSAEGASPEQLASRLAAGLQGFVDGYNSAYEQLDGMGFLYEGVESAIEQTFSDVLTGVAELANTLGIDAPEVDSLLAEQSARRQGFTPDIVAPVTPEPERDSVSPASSVSIASLTTESTSLQSRIDSTPLLQSEIENLNQLIQASTVDYRSSERRSFSFSLTTQDGDQVTLRVASASERALAAGRTEEGNATSLAGSLRETSGFYLDVDGELDDDELFAIDDLLAQIRDVSEQFFAGDLESAFNAALDVGFDVEEIAEFSFSLRQQVITTVQETYEQIRDMNTTPSTANDVFAEQGLNIENEKYLSLARFVDALEDLRQQFERYGVEGFSLLPAQEATTVSDHAGDESRAETIVQSLFSALEVRASKE